LVTKFLTLKLATLTTHNYDVLIIILCSLCDWIALHMLLFNCIFLFWSDSNHISSNSNPSFMANSAHYEVSQLKEIMHYFSALIFWPYFWA